MLRLVARLVAVHQEGKTNVQRGIHIGKRAFAHNSHAHNSAKVLTLDAINPHVKEAEYAVRGALAIRAEALQEELRQGKKLPFDRIVFCNIGNPQQLGQKPITFFRQVASLCENPSLLEEKNRTALQQLYPSDAIARAEEILKHIPSIGAYSHSQGVPYIRESVARFIERRDGYPANPQHIFLTQGASPGVQMVLQLMTKGASTGFMIPIPQYPLYSAALTLNNATPVPYYLKEDKNWALDIGELEKSLYEARDNGVDVRGLVIINPGNPTGQCLSRDNMVQVIEFCHKERLVLLADEVYQTNVYHPETRPFHSFKKIMMSMTAKYQRTELFSFHSTSKGMIGECGRRGGYFECVNIDDAAIDELYKIASISLCPNIHGQIMVNLMTNPPVPGDPSYDQYKQEIDDIYESLKRRATKLAACFKGLEGVSCNDAEGAMYLFPRIHLPKKFITAAKSSNMAPDVFYALELLNATGVCVVSGSGFGQVHGTYHIRSTFLPEEHLFDEFCDKIQGFHKRFLELYKD